MNSNQVKRLSVFVSLLIVIVIFFSVNVITNLSFKGAEVDFTEGNMFSISKETKELVARLDEPVTLRFFYSNKLTNGYPQIKSYAARIIGMLEQFESASSGRIQVQVIDPQPFTDDEDLAISYGLKGAPIDNQGTKVYLGLVATNATDEKQIIPVFHFDRERFLEYDITRIVYDLSIDEKPKVGIMTALPMDASGFMGIPGIGGSSAWIVLEQLRSVFDVVRIDADGESIDASIDVLMIAQPQEITEEMLYHVEQFILAGGRALIMLDPNPEGKEGRAADESDFDTKMNRLLNQWGVHIDPSQVVIDREGARPLPLEEGQSAMTAIEYMGWHTITSERLNSKEIATSSLDKIHVATPGSIEPLEGTDNKISIIPLVTSSPQSMKIPTSKLKGNIPDAKQLLIEFEPTGKEHIMAARLSGEASSAFPEKTAEESHMTQSENGINVILVADTDVMRDEQWARTQDFEGYRIVRPFASNADFIVNLLDYLGGARELINLRGRGGTNKPFEVVEELRRKAEENYLEKEKKLQQELAETEQRLAQMQQQSRTNTNTSDLFQAKQISEINRFSQRMLAIKKELRSVRYELRKEIEALGRKLKVINIALMPLVVCILAVGYGYYRRNRQKRLLKNKGA